jgi:hypothetical protein
MKSNKISHILEGWHCEVTNKNVRNIPRDAVIMSSPDITVAEASLMETKHFKSAAVYVGEMLDMFANQQEFKMRLNQRGLRRLINTKIIELTMFPGADVTKCLRHGALPEDWENRNVHNIPLFHDEEQKDQACIVPPNLLYRIEKVLKLYLVGGKYLMLTYLTNNPAALPRICLPVEDLGKADLRFALQRNLSQRHTRFRQGFCGYYTPSGLIHKVKLRVAPVQENQLVHRRQRDAGGQRQDRHQRDAGGQQQRNGMLGGGDFMPIGGNLMLLPPQQQQQQLPPQIIMQAFELGRQQGRQQALQEAAGLLERVRQEERARLLEAERQERARLLEVERQEREGSGTPGTGSGTPGTGSSTSGTP